MKRISAYKVKFEFLAGGTFGQGPNVGRNWPGRVRLGCSGRKTESQLKPKPSGRVSGPKTTILGRILEHFFDIFQQFLVLTLLRS